jgi:hypothetical protein
MRINFHTNLFDVPKDVPEGTFRGEDVARWLAGQLDGWQTSVVGEDWGWAVLASKGDYGYIFGVYDHDTDEVTAQGPKWVIRLFNERDRGNWFLKLFKNIPPVAHDEVVAEIVGILGRNKDISEVTIEAL